MRDDTFDKLMFLGSVLGVIGLILIFSSNNLGTSLADGWLAKHDYADSSTYEFKVKANTNNFLVTGGILFGVGLATILLVYFKMLNTKE